MCDQREKFISDIKYWTTRCQQAEQQRDHYRKILELSSGIFREDGNLVCPHDPAKWTIFAHGFMLRVYGWYNWLVLPELAPGAVDLDVPWIRKLHDSVAADMEANAYDFSKEAG
jgi:hypothetical protein